MGLEKSPDKSNPFVMAAVGALTSPDKPYTAINTESSDTSFNAVTTEVKEQRLTVTALSSTP